MLARYKTFLGPQISGGAVTSLVEDQERRSDAGAVLAYIHEVRRGLAVRITTQQPDGTARSRGYTGHVFWESNDNGFVHPVVGDTLRLHVAEELLFTGAAATLDGIRKPNEDDASDACETVEVKLNASAPLALCIEPQTGKAKRAIIDAGRPDEEKIEILGYNADAAPGSKIISKWRVAGEPGVQQITSIRASVPVADSELHPSQPSAVWTFASGVPVPIEVLDDDRERGFFVTASINGVQGRFLIDTGSSGIILNRDFAARSRVAVLRNTRMSGFGGDVESQLGTAASLRIGDNVLSQVIVTALGSDLSDSGREIDGLFGYDMFGGAIVKLDPQQRTLTLFDPDTMHLDETGGIALTVGLETLQPVIPMMLNANIPVTGMLDTGDLLAPIVSSQLATKYGLRMLVDRSATAEARYQLFAQGVGGRDNVKCGRIDSLTIAAAVYQGAVACESNRIDENTTIIGFDFLKNFTMYFDYPIGKIVLQPHQ